MKSLRRANLFATLTADAFGGIKLLSRVKGKRTNAFATPATNAFILRELYLIETVLVEQAVNRAEWTHHAAKKSVDKDAT